MPSSQPLGDRGAVLIGAELGFRSAANIAQIEERILVSQYRRLLREFDRTLVTRNGFLLQGVTARLRATSAQVAGQIGRFARFGAKLTTAAQPVFAFVEAYAGEAGYSKPLLYGGAIGIPIFFPGPGTALGVALLTADVGGALNPMTKELDQLILD